MLLKNIQYMVTLAIIGSSCMSLAAVVNHDYIYAQTEEPAEPFEMEYTIAEGNFEDEELGFGLALPDSMRGFVYEFDTFDGSKGLTMQMHPESNVTGASDMPAIEVSPAALLLESGPLNMVRTPVPITGDLFAAIQGYNMRMSIGELNSTQVLVATFDSERSDLPGYDAVKRVGKFYFMNSDDRYISYGLWASEENYQKYLDEFEESAKSLAMRNAKPLDLQSMFSQYAPDTEVILKDGSALHPEIITPSIIENVTINPETNTVRINITEANGKSFLIVNSGELLAGPHSLTIDGEPIEIVTLSNENEEYLVAYYPGSGKHEVAITGTAVVPEFGSFVLFILLAASTAGVIAIKRFTEGV